MEHSTPDHTKPSIHTLCGDGGIIVIIGESIIKMRLNSLIIDYPAKLDDHRFSVESLWLKAWHVYLPSSVQYVPQDQEVKIGSVFHYLAAI